MEQVKPYKDSSLGKKEQVEQMFDNISHRYDFLNRVLSVGVDNWWRRKAIGLLKPYKPAHLLDIATGTGDVAIMAAKQLHCKKITGADISEGMLQYAREKVAKRQLKNIDFVKCDSESLPFADNNFDAAIVAFGVRNFENTVRGLSEIARTLKKDAPLVVLEFSKPGRFPFKQLYFFYFRYILPMFGKLISRDSSAYTYLPESVKAFPEGEDFVKLMQKAGFVNNSYRRLTGGVATLYIGEKN